MFSSRFFVYGSEHDVGEAFAGLLVRFGDDVAVDIRRRARLGVTETLGYGNDVLPVCGLGLRPSCAERRGD